MIDVFPKPELTVNYIFSDSQKKRQSLHPAESLDSEVAQIFDESDPIVAAKILEQIGAKTVRVGKADKALLEETMARARADAKIAQKAEDARRKAVEAEAFGGGDGKSIKKAVAEAHAEYDGFISPEDHQAAIDEAVTKAKDAGDSPKFIKKAVAEVHKEYVGFVSPEDHRAAIDAAADGAGSEVKSEEPPSEEPPKE